MTSQQEKLSIFPSTKTQALTMLYLQQQDLSKLTPKDLVAKYYEVYEQITVGLKQATHKSQS